MHSRQQVYQGEADDLSIQFSDNEAFPLYEEFGNTRFGQDRRFVRRDNTHLVE